MSATPGHSWPLGVCPPHLPCQAAARPAAAHLQAGANPPIEDGEVGVRGQQHGREVHLLADADDGSHFEVEGLQRGCGGRERSEVSIGAPGFSEAACWSLQPSASRFAPPPPTHCPGHRHHQRHVALPRPSPPSPSPPPSLLSPPPPPPPALVLCGQAATLGTRARLLASCPGALALSTGGPREPHASRGPGVPPSVTLGPEGQWTYS